MNLGRKRTTLSNEIAELVKNKIFNNELQGGDKIIVSQIAEEAGISPTPVKEGLKQLQGQDLVVLKPRRGFFVTEIDQEQVEELFEVRLALELYGIEKAIRRKSGDLLQTMNHIVAQSSQLIADGDYQDTDRFLQYDRAFHSALITACGNKKLEEMYTQLNIHIHVSRVLYTESEKRARETHEAHNKILEHFKADELDQARSVLKEHIFSTKEHLKRICSLQKENRGR